MTDCPSQGEVGVWVTTPASERDERLTRHIISCETCAGIVGRVVRDARPDLRAAAVPLAIVFCGVVSALWVFGVPSYSKSGAAENDRRRVFELPSTETTKTAAPLPPGVDFEDTSTWPDDVGQWNRAMLVDWAASFRGAEVTKGALLYERLMEEEIAEGAPRALMLAVKGWGTPNIDAARRYLDDLGEGAVRKIVSETNLTSKDRVRVERCADHYFGARK